MNFDTWSGTRNLTCSSFPPGSFLRCLLAWQLFTPYTCIISRTLYSVLDCIHWYMFVHASFNGVLTSMRHSPNVVSMLGQRRLGILPRVFVGCTYATICETLKCVAFFAMYLNFLKIVLNLSFGTAHFLFLTTFSILESPFIYWEE